jgi:hypothetical protein
LTFPFEQRYADPCFKELDLLAYGARRNTQPMGGRFYTAEPAHFDKGPKTEER